MSSNTSGRARTRVAVIVPSFNSGTTLPATIASILSCGAPVELVVVDDGSTDQRSRQVLLELEANGILVIRQRNLGPAAATSAGVAATDAPYLMRFDSDDLLEPGAVDALADALDATPTAAVAWGDFQTFGLTSFRVPGARALDPWLVTHVNLVPGGGALIRRAALDTTDGWCLRDGFEDWDLWMSFAELGYSGIYVPRNVFRYRRNRSGRQAQARPATTDHYRALLSRHPELVRARRRNLRWSRTPPAMKLLIPAVSAIPFLPRLTKINVCEFLARLLWSRSPRDAMVMLWQGLVSRGHAWLRRA